MFDIGWSEMGIIALVALVVLGPKELPNALRTFSGWMKQLRGMAREFQSGVDQLIREAELEDARKKIEEASRLNVGHEIEKIVDPERSVSTALNAIETDAAAGPKPAEAKPDEPKALEAKPEEPKGAEEAKPAEAQALAAPAPESGAIEVKPAPAAIAAPNPAGIRPTPGAEVKPFPLASGPTPNGAATHLNGADTAAGDDAQSGSASPAEMSDEHSLSASRKAHG
jgi:sec-independent protein translocase protein TatB